MASQRVGVSVICLTWNHLEYTKKAVDSIAPILTPADEIIFVDNNSTDGTQGYLMSLNLPCPTVCHFSDKHISIAHAYNTGIMRSLRPYIFIYDNDLEIVEPDTLNHMVFVFEHHPAAGIVCPHTDNVIGRLRNIQGPEKKFNRIEQFHMKFHRHYPTCPSAAWLIKREVIEKVGVFDERYEGYGMLDFDYARTVMLAGFDILLDGFVFVKHHGSITAKDYDIQPMLMKQSQQFWDKWKLPPSDTRPERFKGRSYE